MSFAQWAGVTQLVECDLAKVDVAGSNPVSRSRFLNTEHRQKFADSLHIASLNSHCSQTFTLPISGGGIQHGGGGNMKSLLRKLGIPAVALAGMLALFTPSQADARVRFGIGIGVGPYAYPAYTYSYPYYGPYYGYPYGYVGGGWGWGHGHFHHGWHR